MFLVLTRMLWTVLEGLWKCYPLLEWSICSTCSSRYFPFFFFFLYRREGLTLVEVIRLFEICYKHYSTDALCPLKTARCFFLRNWLCRFWLCSPPLNCVFLVFFFFLTNYLWLSFSLHLGICQPDCRKNTVSIVLCLFYILTIGNPSFSHKFAVTFSSSLGATSRG